MQNHFLPQVVLLAVFCLFAGPAVAHRVAAAAAAAAALAPAPAVAVAVAVVAAAVAESAVAPALAPVPYPAVSPYTASASNMENMAAAKTDAAPIAPAPEPLGAELWVPSNMPGPDHLGSNSMSAAVAAAPVALSARLRIAAAVAAPERRRVCAPPALPGARAAACMRPRHTKASKMRSPSYPAHQQASLAE